MEKTLYVASYVIQDVLSGRSLTQVLHQQRTKVALEANQKAAVQDISYGVFRHYGLLQFVLNNLLTKSLRDPLLYSLLLASLYQLKYSKFQSYTVVDQAVEATKRLKKKWATGLINATLRNFLQQQDKLVLLADDTEIGRYSYPQWWIAKIKQQYPTKYDSILQVGNRRPVMTLRINHQYQTNESYLKLLNAQGIEASTQESSIVLSVPISVEKLPGFANGWVSVQDLGAQYAAPLLDAKEGMRVLDACAAPGGKTGHLLEFAKLDLTALDQDSDRLRRVSENLERLGLEAKVLVGDASALETWWDGNPYQRILADVPCSASGVVSRHPDIKWLRRETDILQFAAQQKAILKALWQVLDKGGKLLYATCSIFEEENRCQITDFLNQRSDAKELPLSIPDANNGQLLPTPEHNGFFYALLQKN